MQRMEPIPPAASTATVAGAAASEAGTPIPQLAPRSVLAIWAAATVPMGLLAWVGAPMLAGAAGGSHALTRALLVTLTLGLVWQFVLTLILVYREQRTLRWSVVREVMWLRAPRSPRTGRRGGWAWLAVPLFATAFFLIQILVPSLPHPADRDAGAFLRSPAGHSLLHGSWGWFALIAILLVFNTVLGEELLFRGLLLPRMNGAFGRWDWLVNAVLFAAYHVHEWWATPSNLLAGVIFAYSSRRYRSSLMGIAVHSAQTVFILAIALDLVLR